MDSEYNDGVELTAIRSRSEVLHPQPINTEVNGKVTKVTPAPTQSNGEPSQSTAKANQKTQRPGSASLTGKSEMYKQQKNGLPGSSSYFQMGKKDSGGIKTSQSSGTAMKNSYSQLDPFSEKYKGKKSMLITPVKNAAFPQYETLKNRQKVDKAKANIAVGGHAAIAAARLKKGADAKKKDNGFFKLSDNSKSALNNYQWQAFKSRNEEYRVQQTSKAISEPQETTCDGILASKLMLATYVLAAPVAEIQPYSSKSLINIEDVLAEENEMQEMNKSEEPEDQSEKDVYIIPVPFAAAAAGSRKSTTPKSRTSNTSSYHLRSLFATPQPEPEPEPEPVEEVAMPVTGMVISAAALTAKSSSPQKERFVDRSTSALTNHGGEIATQTTPVPILDESSKLPQDPVPETILQGARGTPVKNAIIAGSVIHAQNLHINYYHGTQFNEPKQSVELVPVHSQPEKRKVIRATRAVRRGRGRSPSPVRSPSRSPVRSPSPVQRSPSPVLDVSSQSKSASSRAEIQTPSPTPSPTPSDAAPSSDLYEHSSSRSTDRSGSQEQVTPTPPGSPVEETETAYRNPDDPLSPISEEASSAVPSTAVHRNPSNADSAISVTPEVESSHGSSASVQQASPVPEADDDDDRNSAATPASESDDDGIDAGANPVDAKPPPLNGAVESMGRSRAKFRYK